MKKALFLLGFLPTAILAQTSHGNGLYKVGLPTGVVSTDLRSKRALLEDDSAAIWIGFGYHSFSKGDIGLGKWKNGNWTMYRTSNSGILSNKITDLTEGDSSDILIATQSGLSIFNRKHNSWTNFTTGNSSLPSNYLNSLARSGSVIWLGTKNGLVKWEQGQMTIYDSGDWGTLSDEVLQVEVSGNSVFVATEEGLVEGKNGVWTLYQHQSKLKGINRMSLNTQGILYVYSDSGLYTFQNGTIDAFPSSFECLSRLSKDHLKNGIGLNSDASGAVYFLAGSDPAGPALSDLYLYRSLNGEVGEMVFYSREPAYGPSVHLQTDRSGNLWILNTKTDSIVLIKPDEYVREPGPDLQTGKNFHTLDINRVNAAVLDRGDLFWNSHDRSLTQIPKGSCTSPVFASALWIGGVDAGGDLHMAAQTYRQSGSDFFHGPLDTQTLQGSTDENSPYNRIWKISRHEIEAFQQAFANGEVGNGTYTIPTDILQWPGNGAGNYSRMLAPFTDINGDDVYNPFDGDYPDIKGDQMLFWIFNDNTGIHSESGGKPFGLEVHASAYAYYCHEIEDGDSNEVLNYTTFYHYKIFNRSDSDYYRVYYGNWTDVDLGNYLDDRVGCDTVGNFAFGYNGDNVDEGGMGYGENPPMINVLWLSDTMYMFSCYRNDYSPIGNPTTAQHYYNILESRWKDSSWVTYGGSGYQTGSPTRYMVPGNPYDTAQWSDVTSGLQAGDRRMVSAAYDDVLPSGGVKELEYALVYTRVPDAPNGLNTSWVKNKTDIDKVKVWYLQNNFPSCALPTVYRPVEEIGQQLIIYPNPGQGSFTLLFGGEEVSGARVQVYDLSGKLVLESPETHGPVDTGILMPGIYLIRVHYQGEIYSGKWVKQH